MSTFGGLLNNTWGYITGVGAEKLWALAKILIFFVVVRFVAYRLTDRVLKRAAQRATFEASLVSAGRLKTVATLTRSTVFYALVFVSGIMVLRVFDLDVGPVLTAAGVVGLAVGFGAQKLVRDIISGFFIVLENQYAVGEYVTIGGATGVIEELGMRVTQIRDDAGKLVVIPNGDIGQVVNHSRGPILASLEIAVSADADLDKVRAAIDAAGEHVAKHVEGIVSPPKADGISAMDGAKVVIRVSGEVKPGRQDAVQTALREQIRAQFRKDDIRLV